MPGKEIPSPTAPSISPNLSLLKSHKSLPKRRVISSNIKPVQVITAKVPKSDLERQGYSSSERIRSWIPEPSGVQAIPDPALPLTPPLNASESVDRLNHSEHPPNLSHGNNTSNQTVSSGISTPVLQRSPPTPETTPPKLDRYISLTHESSEHQLPSTRAESFETAREDQVSQEYTSLLESPSLRASRQQWLKDAAHLMPENIGLGLGLEHSDGQMTPTGLEAEASGYHEDVVSFGSAWNGATPEMEAVKGGADIAHRSELKKRQDTGSRISDQLLKTPPISNTNTPSPIARSLSLRQRIDQARATPPRASLRDFAEKIQWPLRDDSPTFEEKLREMDNKRFSQLSSASTIVEAMVFNTPPQRRKTLRHSSKFADLSLATTQTNRNSTNINDRNQRRLSRHSKSPDGGQRASFASGPGVGGGDSIVLPRQRQDVVPVIVIPERISSLGSKSPYVHFLRRVQPLTFDWQQLSRPTTAPEDAVGYFDVPRTQRRIVSAFVSTPSKNDSSIGTRKVQPRNAPAEASSSAHTSQHASRTTSDTSTGVNSIGPLSRQQSRLGHQCSETPTARVISADEESNGDWSVLRPRSSLVTPFSLRSARSSTPGTLEVNEATAISIYPHTNKSILVVQHAARRDSHPAEHSAIIASNAKFAIPAGSVQPPVIHQPRQLLNSPLQNPRSPPEPPDFKIIPPTPANATENPGPDHEDKPPSEQQTPKRRLSNRVKRAFSTRRYSEVFATPLARSFSLSSRRNTVYPSARRASTGIDPDRNLHPFWRPRAFWDEGSDSDSDFGNDGPLVGNSLGMPTDGVKTFDPPKRRASLSQRLGSLRLSRRGRRSESVQPTRRGFYDSSHDDQPMSKGGAGPGGPLRRFNSSRGRKFYRSYAGDDNASYEFIQRPQQAPSHNGEVAEGTTDHGVPRLGYQVQFVGFKGLAEKVKERREKARREKVRERLRGSIDVLRGV
ncbi:MAG: hypothetical protein L6R40_008066 [Gallowayella cf. fulva]|nr:MAG: hypothetical protein L6R40_008066 [Xanthomendoza cf. fulva]